MNYRQLGNTGIRVSEIGMGCWGIGSDAYGISSDSQSLITLETAIDQGINFFDTADIYGAGRSEELIGKAVKGKRDKVVIATKVGSLPHKGREMPHILTPGHIEIAVNASLMRLQTDYIDLYQLHSPPLEHVEQIREAIDTLVKLKKEGKIRAIGVSAKSPCDAFEAYANPKIEVFQTNLNLIDQRAIYEEGLLDVCEWDNVGIIARTPLAFGFLTGQYSKGTQFSPPDHRANWPQKQIDTWADAHNLFRHIKPTDMTWTQFALSFCISHSAISTVIPGMLTPEEVFENMNIQVLGGAVLEEIKRVYMKHTFFLND